MIFVTRLEEMQSRLQHLIILRSVYIRSYPLDNYWQDVHTM